ncbi:hypothetical protein RBB79_16905 [Tunturiibacter empetritectus]|uniref:Uncharacterized protein n=1 Tax=Tunturiibacter lichenicola TaxID=2051959 RepID=A0A852VLL1_9BACT|nr:hypothetical protein [Edaphobacter lichenicola]NYF91304.1 hypothetical protein [Edaphobacter lichenicola]
MKNGSKVEIVFSESWELVTQIGDRPFQASIQKIAHDGDSALLNLDLPIVYQGQTTSSLIATPRHQDASFNNITNHLVCGLIAVDAALIESFDRIKPRILTSWFQAIGTITQR